MTVRFIPTYVGYTDGHRTRLVPATVHPHIRGVYFRSCAGFYSRRGSSPHTWGIRAGARPPVSVFGSSPHTWGIRRLRSNHRIGRRFIPTYVGYTHANNPAISRCTVHPHIRGAYSVYPSFLPSVFGSSPPTWGIPLNLARIAFFRRFIPTYVGHTARAVRRRPQAAGSSPPTWGIRTGWGNYPPAQRVHPHLRGAYAAGRGRFPAPPGSSPHTWGIPYIRPFGCSHPRFIPTYVGHTPEGKSHSLRDLGSSPHT